MQIPQPRGLLLEQHHGTLVWGSILKVQLIPSPVVHPKLSRSFLSHPHETEGGRVEKLQKPRVVASDCTNCQIPLPSDAECGLDSKKVRQPLKVVECEQSILVRAYLKHGERWT